MPLDDLIEGIHFLENTVGGWRYLFSRSYRLKKHREWQEQGLGAALLDVVVGLAGVVISLVLLVLAAMVLWNAFHA